MVDTDTVFDLLIAFQIGALNPENLKFWVLFLTPLMYQVVISK